MTPSPAGEHPIPDARILVIEDDAAIRQILRIQLENARFEVETADGGRAGLARAAEMQPDLILLDVMMPEIDGFEVCRRLRSLRATAHIPVIMLTARTASRDKVIGLENGANDYLAKPIEGPELIARVRSVLCWSRAQRDASPLTGLPGNIAVEAAAATRLAAGGPFGLLYADVDYFKAYNDRYGYRRGDDAIRLVAELLLAVVESVGTAGDFVGHVGGDDFVALTAPDRALPVAHELVRRFDAAVPDLYDETDRARGWIEVQGRRGGTERAPLVSLTVAVVIAEPRRFIHYAALTDVVAQLKQYGKSRPGSIVVHDRRVDEGQDVAASTCPAAPPEEEQDG